MNTFGDYSGFWMNWDKSILFPVDQAAIPLVHPDFRLQVVPSCRYLGIVVQLPLSSYINNNLCPLLSQLQLQTKQWMDLPLYLTGRANVIKMIYIPKLFYVMANSPCKIPKSIFKHIDTICTVFLWNGRPPRVALEML